MLVRPFVAARAVLPPVRERIVLTLQCLEAHELNQPATERRMNGELISQLEPE